MNYALLMNVLFSSEFNKYSENVFFKFKQMCGVSPICYYTNIPDTFFILFLYFSILFYIYTFLLFYKEGC